MVSLWRTANVRAVEEPLTITSFALSLLLVFRTNSSYGRFAEARQLWGLMLNRSRDLSRQVHPQQAKPVTRRSCCAARGTSCVGARAPVCSHCVITGRRWSVWVRANMLVPSRCKRTVMHGCCCSRGRPRAPR